MENASNPHCYWITGSTVALWPRSVQCISILPANDPPATASSVIGDAKMVQAEAYSRMAA